MVTKGEIEYFKKMDPSEYKEKNDIDQANQKTFKEEDLMTVHKYKYPKEHHIKTQYIGNYYEKYIINDEKKNDKNANKSSVLSKETSQSEKKLQIAREDHFQYYLSATPYAKWELKKVSLKEVDKALYNYEQRKIQLQEKNNLKEKKTLEELKTELTDLEDDPSTRQKRIRITKKNDKESVSLSKTFPRETYEVDELQPNQREQFSKFLQHESTREFKRKVKQFDEEKKTPLSAIIDEAKRKKLIPKNFIEKIREMQNRNEGITHHKLVEIGNKIYSVQTLSNHHLRKIRFSQVIKIEQPDFVSSDEKNLYQLQKIAEDTVIDYPNYGDEYRGCSDKFASFAVCDNCVLYFKVTKLPESKEQPDKSETHTQKESISKDKKKKDKTPKDRFKIRLFKFNFQNGKIEEIKNHFSSKVLELERGQQSLLGIYFIENYYYDEYLEDKMLMFVKMKHQVADQPENNQDGSPTKANTKVTSKSNESQIQIQFGKLIDLIDMHTNLSDYPSEVLKQQFHFRAIAVSSDSKDQKRILNQLRSTTIRDEDYEKLKQQTFVMLLECTNSKIKMKAMFLINQNIINNDPITIEYSGNKKFDAFIQELGGSSSFTHRDHRNKYSFWNNQHHFYRYLSNGKRYSDLQAANIYQYGKAQMFVLLHFSQSQSNEYIFKVDLSYYFQEIYEHNNVENFKPVKNGFNNHLLEWQHHSSIASSNSRQILMSRKCSNVHRDQRGLFINQERKYELDQNGPLIPKRIINQQIERNYKIHEQHFDKIKFYLKNNLKYTSKNIALGSAHNINTIAVLKFYEVDESEAKKEEDIAKKSGYSFTLLSDQKKNPNTQKSSGDDKKEEEEEEKKKDDDKPDSKKKIIEIKVSDIEFSDQKRTLASEETFEFIENNSAEQSFLFYNSGDHGYQDFLFCLIKEGKPIKGTEVKLPSSEVFLPHEEDFSHTVSSELRQGIRYKDQGVTETYWSRQYTACFFNYTEKIVLMFEIQVLYFKGDGHTLDIGKSSIKWDSLDRHAMITGLKRLIFTDEAPNYCRVLPLFDEEKSDSSQIIGFRYMYDGRSLEFKNLDHSKLKELAEKELMYPGEFTLSRCRFVQSTNTMGIVEAWWRQEFIQNANSEIMQTLMSVTKDLQTGILTNALQRTLNSKLVCFLPDLQFSPIFQRIREEGYDESLDWLGPPSNIFAATDLFDGNSIGEAFCDSPALKRSIKYIKDQCLVDHAKSSLYCFNRSEQTFIGMILNECSYSYAESRYKTNSEVFPILDSEIDLFKLNLNLQSPLTVVLETLQKDSAIDTLMNLLQESAESTEKKRTLIMNFLHFAVVTFHQQNQQNKNKVFNEILQFLADPDEQMAELNDEEQEQEPEKSKDDKEIKIHLPTKRVHIRQQFDQSQENVLWDQDHFSQVLRKKELLKERKDEGKSGNISSKEIQEQALKILNEKKPASGDKQLQISFIDFQDMALQEKIRKLLSSQNQKDLKEAENFSFDFRDYVGFLHNMLDMSVMAGTEADELLVLRDLVQHAYEKVRDFRTYLSQLYQFGFILPLIIQIVYGQASRYLVIICSSICLLTQCGITVSEVKSLISRPNPSEYFQERQNIFDFMSIIFTLFYCVLRIQNPTDASVNQDTSLESTGIEKGMPLIHFTMITLAFLQWLEYLQMMDFLNKYISLLFKAMSDITGFMVLFLWLLAYFCLIFYVTGATFDDGGNFDQENYDTDHNDYPVISQGFVFLLQNFRTSIGDLQSPSYDYWMDRQANGDEYFSFFLIFLIWFMWFSQIIIVVICMLNFLIAIVSESYAYIIESEQLQGIQRRESICLSGMYDVTVEGTNIDIIFMATKLSSQGADEWAGVAKSIKNQNSALKKLMNSQHKELQRKMNVNSYRANIDIKALLKEDLKKIEDKFEERFNDIEIKNNALNANMEKILMILEDGKKGEDKDGEKGEQENEKGVVIDTD